MLVFNRHCAVLATVLVGKNGAESQVRLIRYRHGCVEMEAVIIGNSWRDARAEVR